MLRNMSQHLNAVAWVISPINILQCMIAHKHMETYFGQSITLRLFHYYPSTDPDLSHSIFETVQKLSTAINSSVECVEVDEKNAAQIISGSRADFIMLAHDVVGNLYGIMKDIYPKAKTICYGDALGQFFEKDVHLSYLRQNNPLQNIMEWIKNRKSRKLSKKDYAILTIPVSQSPLPSKTMLLIPNRDTAVSIVEKAALNNPELIAYCNSIMAKIDSANKTFFFPIENMAEGLFISAEDEAALYSESIRKHCPPGSTIIIKPHPGEQFDRTPLLEKNLSGQYKLLKIDPAFKRYPIELFLPILKQSQVISMFYPLLSLKYLYGMDVIQPLSDEMIEKYFDQKFQESYKNAISLNAIPLTRLSNWDGKTLLYNGR